MNSDERGRPQGGVPLAIVAGMGWTWAVLLLATRHHLTGLYRVLPGAPAAWGFVVLSNAGMLAAVCLGGLWAVGCARLAYKSGQAFPPCTRWLCGAWVVPLADLVRLAGYDLPRTFFEPILLAGLTGAAAAALARGLEIVPGRDPAANHAGWLAGIWVLAAACAGWWYWQAQQAYDNYLLGYNDFGHFAFRVASTWEGRGFLQETPCLPVFWDHFNPGLALLAPLWGLWPDAGLFLVIQAVSLALPAPLVYGVSRRAGASPAGAAAWAAAYLTFPALGQLNLNYFYGWHPVSLALPLLFAAMWAFLRAWPVTAGTLAVLACSFQEDVLVVVACLAIALGLQAWLDRRSVGVPRHCAAMLARRLPWWGWAVAAAFLLAGFFLAFEMAGFAQFQVSRFAALGESLGEVMLSPVLRPRAFWGTVLQPASAYFLLALLVPLGLRVLLRGWVVLLALVVPIGVLLAWEHVPAKLIAFQYTTTLIPVLFLAALTGAANTRPSSLGVPKLDGDSPVFASRKLGQSPVGRPADPAQGLWAAGVGALAASLAASSWFGAMPFSAPTLTDVVGLTYAWQGDDRVLKDRKVGSAGNAMLNRIVAQIGGKDSSVLATGRVAAHFLRVRRLDTVAQARQRWKAFQAEVGAGQSPLVLFDWIVLDTGEHFHQSEEDLRFIAEEAKRAGFRLVEHGHDILVLAR